MVKLITILLCYTRKIFLMFAIFEIVNNMHDHPKMTDGTFQFTQDSHLVMVTFEVQWVDHQVDSYHGNQEWCA